MGLLNLFRRRVDGSDSDAPGSVRARLERAAATQRAGGAQSEDSRRLARQTENVMWILAILGILSVVVLFFWSTVQASRIDAFTWAFVAALAALVIGGSLGLLFGLPTAQTGSVGPTSAHRDEDLGYRESTSLEQVADWLTKILIGLTLTQFENWELRFSRMSANLTQVLTGRDSPLPGGVLLAFYAVLGFLMAYLWMRRYFIHELVAANAESRALRKRAQEVIEATTVREIEIRSELQAAQAEADKLKAKSERLAAEAELRKVEERLERAELEKVVKAALDQGRAQTTSELTKVPDNRAVTILRKGASLLPAESKGMKALAAIEKAILDKPTDQEDPWRGKFGDQSTADGKTLEAKVTPTSNPETFRVELVVRTLAQPPPESVIGKKTLFYLHPTFGPEPRVSTLGDDGRAPLELYAYGAFTVGVVTEDGTTLELNLATLADAPDAFRSR